MEKDNGKMVPRFAKKKIIMPDIKHVLKKEPYFIGNIIHNMGFLTIFDDIDLKHLLWCYAWNQDRITEYEEEEILSRLYLNEMIPEVKREIQEYNDSFNYFEQMPPNLESRASMKCSMIDIAYHAYKEKTLKKIQRLKKVNQNLTCEYTEMLNSKDYKIECLEKKNEILKNRTILRAKQSLWDINRRALRRCLNRMKCRLKRWVC